MNDNQPIPNPAFRAAVTDTAFSFTLRKTHLSVLSIIAAGSRHDRLPYWVPAVNGLIRRGLVRHKHSPGFTGARWTDNTPITEYFRLTKAGWLMFDLCVEAGLLEPVTSKSQRKLVA